LVLENLPDNAELAKRFLLGDVSDAERAQIEDRFLASDDFHQELLLAEDDLIDAYVRGELPANDRALFARSYLNSPARSERLEFARRLSHTVSGKPLTAAAVAADITADTAADTIADTVADTAPGRAHARTSSPWHSLFGDIFVRRPAHGFALAAAALLFVVLGGLWLLWETAPPRPAPEIAQTIPPAPPAPSPSAAAPAPAPPAPAAAPVQTLSPAAPAPSPRESASPRIAGAEKSPSNPEKKVPASRETPGKRTPFVVALTLLPGLARGESSAQLILPDAATEVRLRLGMDGETYKKYRATLSTPEGRKVWSRVLTHKPATEPGRLTLSLPADLLKSGDYVLEIGGANADGGDVVWESVADYAFRVLRK
jgi:cell division septation protein DedD